MLLKVCPSGFCHHASKKYHIYNCYMVENQITVFNPLINPLFLTGANGNIFQKTKQTLQRTIMYIQNMQTKPCHHKSPDLQHALRKPFYIRTSALHPRTPQRIVKYTNFQTH